MNTKFNLDLTIQIPLSFACNLKCIGCPRQNERIFEKFLFFDLAFLKKILYQLRELKRPFVLLPVWLGEALLHPQITEIFNMIAEILSPQPYFRGIILHTNGIFLSPYVFDKILQCKVKFDLIISLDAACEDEYKDIKGFNYYKKVVNNVRKLLDYLVYYENPSFFKTSLQFLVFKRNWKSVKRFVDFWKKEYRQRNLNVEVVVAPYGDRESNYQHKLLLRRVDSDLSFQQKYEDLHKKALVFAGIIKDDYLTSRRIIQVASSAEKTLEKSKTICPAPFKFLVIDINGDLFFCWKDKKKALKIGNLQAESLENLLNSKKYIDFLYSHWKRNLENYPICKNCNGFDIAPLKQNELNEIEKMLGK